MKCDQCVFNHLKHELPWCQENRENCDKLFPIPERQKRKLDTICNTCKRKKDPGKCWWCENE